MSINYCTIANTTVDTFCGNKRAIVLSRLIKELHPEPIRHPGGNVQQSKYTNYTQAPRWEPPVISTERDRIVVQAKFQELRGTDEQANEQRLDIVFVTNLRVDPATISVNIKNIKVF